jgi:hypothetical protein
MAWLRRLVAGLSPQRPWFAPRSVHAGFVVDSVAFGQVFLRVLPFPLVNIIPKWQHVFPCSCWMNNSPVGGRSSET